MSKIRLGVNIDHVATVRNARGESYPSPLRAALLAQKSGADSVTIHLREDRRHINELDLKQIKSKLKIPLNLEIAATKEMLNIALKRKPPFICIVPEKRQEITTEGGLNLKFRRNFLKSVIDNKKLWYQTMGGTFYCQILSSKLLIQNVKYMQKKKSKNFL